MNQGESANIQELREDGDPNLFLLAEASEQITHHVAFLPLPFLEAREDVSALIQFRLLKIEKIEFAALPWSGRDFVKFAKCAQAPER